MIGFAGLSHLGIVYSLATAAKGFDVVAFQPSAELTDALGHGRFPIEEPGLVELFSAHREKLRYTARATDLSRCDVVFVSLDIKTDDANQSDTAPLTQLLRTVTAVMKPGAALVILSQVNPGFTRRFIAAAGPVSFAIYYQVETLVFGRAVERAINPERYMVGAADPKAPLPTPLQQWHARFGCPVLVMGYESAELAKIAINFFLVSTVTTTNTLAELCANIGADWNEIAPALRLDARIGPRAYLTPGLGLSGGNLERDLMTVKQLSEGSDADTGVIDSWLDNSRHMKSWPARVLEYALRSGDAKANSGTLAIWGLAYKENTHSTKNSPSLAFMALHDAYAKRAYDPVVVLPADAFPNFEQRKTALACCDGADALLLLTPWPEFRTIKLADIRTAMRGDVIVDPFGLLNASEAQEFGFDYYRLGTPPRVVERTSV
jgi:UDPglucose 6-dehydrogenase